MSVLGGTPTERTTYLRGALERVSIHIAKETKSMPIERLCKENLTHDQILYNIKQAYEAIKIAERDIRDVITEFSNGYAMPLTKRDRAEVKLRLAVDMIFGTWEERYRK